MHLNFYPVAVNFNCQLHRTYNHRGNKSLGMSLRECFLTMLIEVGSPTLTCGQHHSLCWNSPINKKHLPHATATMTMTSFPSCTVLGIMSQYFLK